LANPLSQLASSRAELLLNLSASPFTLHKWGRREAIFRAVAEQHRVKVVMANQVGANDELVFDGSSVVWSETGQLLARARSFEEQLLLVELDAPSDAAAKPVSPPEPIEATYAALVLGVRDYA